MLCRSGPASTLARTRATPVFAIAHLLGIDLVPSIRDRKDLLFFRPSRAARCEHIDALFAGAGLCSGNRTAIFTADAADGGGAAHLGRRGTLMDVTLGQTGFGIPAWIRRAGSGGVDADRVGVPSGHLRPGQRPEQRPGRQPGRRPGRRS
ncbi:Tn3 family transposase [Kitasatospora sp. NPDC056138]|uniref:Tn3 family transposase n=1 Tax=Kitasatospora sp. NPDC056138 TaxID=3345724 RepID=UPI0035DAD583